MANIKSKFLVFRFNKKGETERQKLLVLLRGGPSPAAKGSQGRGEWERIVLSTTAHPKAEGTITAPPSESLEEGSRLLNGGQFYRRFLSVTHTKAR